MSEWRERFFTSVVGYKEFSLFKLKKCAPVQVTRKVKLKSFEVQHEIDRPEHLNVLRNR